MGVMKRLATESEHRSVAGIAETMETAMELDVRKHCEWGGLAGPASQHANGYREFIRSKTRKAESFGFDWNVDNPHPYEWQKRVIEWSVRRGRAGIFADCGLGKTLMQLLWADAIVRHTNRNVLIHCPVGVRAQTKREADKFGIEDVNVVNGQEDVKPGISLINYEKLHKIDPTTFVGVVLDESSILKSYTGSTKRKLIETWNRCRYKLACTATPAPNDHMELGNHADFLGVMPSNEMLSRWFINDTMRAGGYRLMRHAETDFWQWMASWAISLEKPSDIGGSDEGFILPSLNRINHIVDEPEDRPGNGMLFHNYELSATNVHKQKRRTAEPRAAKVAELVEAEPDQPWLIWCDTNYESDALKKMIPDSHDVRGSDSAQAKEDALLGFSSGDINRLITKPTIAGFGMNWQHCRRIAFVGLSYSYEQFYQAVRRCWRFGQTEPVNAHVIMSEGEHAITETVDHKERLHKAMKHSMSESMKDFTAAEIRSEVILEDYEPQTEMELPAWLK